MARAAWPRACCHSAAKPCSRVSRPAGSKGAYIQATDSGKAMAIRFASLDSAVALMFAFFINAAILVMAAAVFYRAGLFDVAEIQDAHRLLAPLVGSKLAPALFAVALICSGQSSTITGTLAGHNAARYAKKEKSLILPTTLAIGDAINHVRTQMETEEGLGYKYTFSGSVYFERMKQKGLYSIDRKEIEKRVGLAGLSGAFSPK